MGIAQNLKATHGVDESVRGVADQVLAVSNNVAGVDDRVAGVSDRVAGVDDRVRVVDARVAEVIHGAFIVKYSRNHTRTMNHSDGKEAQVVMQQTATDVDQVKRLSSHSISPDYRVLSIFPGSQLRESIHRWLSPPDPSTNHNIACSTHHKKTAPWFFQGSIFQEWKSTGSLLWIHGKR